MRDPYHATNAFYDALAKVPDYKVLRITEAAQLVQRSGFPEAYEAHAPDARTLASVLTGYSPGGLFSCVVNATGRRQTAAEVIRVVERAYGNLDLTRTGSRQDVVLRVSDDEAGRRLGWSVAQFVVAHGTRLRPASVTYDGRTWSIGRASESGWTGATGTADPTRVRITMG